MAVGVQAPVVVLVVAVVVLALDIVSVGIDVRTAENGAEALKKVSDELHLIVLDLSMPVMDGFEFLTEFNQMDLSPRPQVIIFSGMSLDDSLKEALSDVHAGVIDKNEKGLGQKIRQLAKELSSA